MSADFSHTSGIKLAGQPDFEIATLRIRPNLREVQAGSETERLEPRVMQALVALAERPGEVLSRDALIERCWDGRIVGDDAINRCMTKLRKVGAEHGAFSIEAIPKVGYRLVVTANPAAPVRGEPANASTSKRRWLWSAVGAAVVVLAVLAGVVLWLSAPASLSTATPFVVAEITTARPDDGLKAFAVTTVGDIKASLARYHLPTTLASGTRFEINGVVNSEAGRTVARLNIVALPSSTLIWSKAFDGPAGNEAILHAQIASRVGAVADMMNEMLVRRSSDFDAETLALLIKGVDGISNGTWNSRTGPEEAVRRSPRSAVAHASYAVPLFVASGYVAPDKAGDLRSRAGAELARALELDPQTPETAVLQITMMDDLDWSAALKIASEPPRGESAYGKMARGILLAGAGRARDAMLPLYDAMERLGERPGRSSMLIYGMRAGGGDAGALDLARRKILLLPDDYTLRAVLLDLVALRDRPDETLAILDDTSRRPTNSTVSLEAYRRFAVWQRDGGAADRIAAIAAVTTAAKVGLPPESAVPMLVRLGDLGAAFDVAEAAASPPTRVSGRPYNATFLYYADTAAMRRSPRFIALANKLGLLRFWRETGSWPDFCEREPDTVCAQMQGR